MREIFDGFSKNLFRVASYKYPTAIAAPIFTFGLLLYATIYSMPAFVLLAWLILGLCGMPAPADIAIYGSIAVLLTSTSFALVYKSFGYSLRMICTYPVQVILFFIIAMNSMISTLRGKTSWKGRPLHGQAPCLKK